MRCQNKIYPRHIRLDASVGHHIPVFLLSVSLLSKNNVDPTPIHSQLKKIHIHNLFFIRDSAYLLPGFAIAGWLRDSLLCHLVIALLMVFGIKWLLNDYSRGHHNNVCVYVRNYQCKSYIFKVCACLWRFVVLWMWIDCLHNIYDDQTD